MIKTSTLLNSSNAQQQQLILSLYGELSATKQADLNVSMLLDQTLAEENEELKEIQQELNKFSEEPDDSSIQNILKYSTSFARLC